MTSPEDVHRRKIDTYDALSQLHINGKPGHAVPQTNDEELKVLVAEHLPLAFDLANERVEQFRKVGLHRQALAHASFLGMYLEGDDQKTRDSLLSRRAKLDTPLEQRRDAAVSSYVTTLNKIPNAVQRPDVVTMALGTTEYEAADRNKILDALQSLAEYDTAQRPYFEQLALLLGAATPSASISKKVLDVARHLAADKLRTDLRVRHDELEPDQAELLLRLAGVAGLYTTTSLSNVISEANQIIIPSERRAYKTHILDTLTSSLNTLYGPKAS